MKNGIVSSLIAVALALPLASGAETPPSAGAGGDSSMEALREKLRADKRYVVAQHMDLTEAEAAGFWPLYDEYQKGLAQINRRIATLTSTYVDAHDKAPISDEVARKLLKDHWEIEASELALEKHYIGKMKKVLPMHKVFRYAQLENKVRAVIRYELAASIPIAD
jgi:Lhr-like helicase